MFCFAFDETLDMGSGGPWKGDTNHEHLPLVMPLQSNLTRARKHEKKSIGALYLNIPHSPQHWDI